MGNACASPADEGSSREAARREAAARRRAEELRRAEAASPYSVGEEVVRRAEEELGLPEHELLADFEPEEELELEGALQALSDEVGSLKKTLERLGPVNLEAVEELEGVSERLGFLEGERRDLVRARTSLEGTIQKIDQESERLFLETFNQIRGHFQTLFRRLFGGGRADITLAEGEPVLEAGIEIMARPPGREMLPIGLLSGGQRSMTALGLLFAIFQTRPSPFCVLDEVDAALDDANISRFLTLLDGFRGSTQFIVVTHNKGTMSASDALYGVTMEVRGVSRQVSVELSEVDEFVPDAAGSADISTRRVIEESVLSQKSASDGEDATNGELCEEEQAADEPVIELVPESPSGPERAAPVLAQEEGEGSEVEAPSVS